MLLATSRCSPRDLGELMSSGIRMAHYSSRKGSRNSCRGDADCGKGLDLTAGIRIAVASRPESAPEVNVLRRRSPFGSLDQCASSQWIKAQFRLMTVISTHMRIVLSQSPSAFAHTCQKSLNDPNRASSMSLPRQISGDFHLQFRSSIVWLDRHEQACTEQFALSS